MIHANTIKAEVRKNFPNVKVLSIERKSFGIFVVKVSEERARSTRKGFLMGETDHDRSSNGVVLDRKINW